MWMNTYEIDDAYNRYRGHVVLGPAARTLVSFRDAVDSHSDGWPYWSRATKAAAKLMELVTRDGTAKYYYSNTREDATEKELRAALAVLKGFKTKTGLPFTLFYPGGETK